MCFILLALGELGEASFRLLEFGELGKVIFRLSKLGELDKRTLEFWSWVS